MLRWTMLALLPLLLFAAAPAQEKKGQLFQSDYLPLKVGNRWIYKAGKEKVTVEVERQETIKRKVKTQDDFRYELIEAFRLKITAGDKTLHEHVVVAEDGIYRVSAAGKEIQPPLRLLKLPPMADDSWLIDSVTENIVLKGRFATLGDKVSVPAYPEGVAAVLSSCDDFQIGSQRMSARYWFVPKVGIVKQEVKAGTSDVSMELERFEPAK
ncbi:MAG: hypothetical protein K2X38_05245 [Gemmataceae bacterium]|nr:hypothetical protein [Gemmataceae bacterium]